MALTITTLLLRICSMVFVPISSKQACHHAASSVFEMLCISGTLKLSNTTFVQIWSDKIKQLGGILEDHLSHDVTHIFSLDILKLQGRVTPRKLRKHHVKTLKYEWIQDCLKEGHVVPLEPYELKIEAMQVTSEKVEDRKRQQRDVNENSRHDSAQLEKEAMSVARDRTLSGSSDSSTTGVGSDDSGGDQNLSSVVEHESATSQYIPPNLNQEITVPFAELSDIYKNALGDDRRSFSYHKAISMLEKLPFKIEHIDQVKGLPTIGKSLQEHIYEILATGKLSKLEAFKNDEKVRTLILFSSIWGIGPATAKRFYEKGHRCLEDLKHEPSLTGSQRIGLHFYNDLNVKIPRHEVKEMEAIVKRVSEEIQPHVNVLCGGSYRRGKLLCSDMDFVITHPDGSSHKGFLVKLIAALKKIDFLTEDLLVSDRNSIEGTDSGVDTFFGLCKYPGRELRHRIDFKVYSIEMYPFGLIAWTGNDVLNRRLRSLAESKGFRLDDTGLYPLTKDSHGNKVKSLRMLCCICCHGSSASYVLNEDFQVLTTFHDLLLAICYGQFGKESRACPLIHEIFGLYWRALYRNAMCTEKMF